MSWMSLTEMAEPHDNVWSAPPREGCSITGVMVTRSSSTMGGRLPSVPSLTSVPNSCTCRNGQAA